MKARQRLLTLRVLALQSVVTGYEPHIEIIQVLAETSSRRLGGRENEINHLTWRYRRQISPELVPFICKKPQ